MSLSGFGSTGFDAGREIKVKYPVDNLQGYLYTGLVKEKQMVMWIEDVPTLKVEELQKLVRLIDETICQQLWLEIVGPVDETEEEVTRA